MELMLTALQLFKGISHLADHQVSHRDLKVSFNLISFVVYYVMMFLNFLFFSPQDDNVFIQNDGTLVIADFGCALDCKYKLYVDQEDVINRLGAPATTAPEVHYITFLYSFCCSIYPYSNFLKVF